MSGNKRNKQDEVDILQRRCSVAKLVAEGKNQPEIARSLQISQPTVSADIQALERQWRQTANFDFAAARGRVLNGLEHVRAEAFGGWHRSRRPKRTTTKAVSSSDSGKDGKPKDDQTGDKQEDSKSPTKQTQRVATRDEERDGDPRFIQTVLMTYKTEMDLLGLEVAPEAAAEDERRGIRQAIIDSLTKEEKEVFYRALQKCHDAETKYRREHDLITTDGVLPEGDVRVIDVKEAEDE